MVHNYTSKRKYGKHKKSNRPKHTGIHKLEEDRTISESRYHSMKVEDGKYKFTLGNWTDAGWFWDGDEEDSWLFLNRMRASRVKDKLVEDMSQEEFEAFKKVLEKQLEKDNYGLYSLSGDNVEWHFGHNDWIDVDAELDYYKDEYGLTEEQVVKLSEEVWDNYETREYEDFEEEYADYYKNNIKELLEESNTIDDLINDERWQDLKFDIIESVREFRDEDFREAIYETMDELGYTKKKK